MSGDDGRFAPFDDGDSWQGGARAAGGGAGPRPPRRQRPGRRPPSRGARSLLVLAGLVLLASWSARWWTDYLWYGSVGASQVFTTRLGVQLLLGGASGLLTALAVGASLHLAHRHRPVYAPSTPAEVALDEYRAAIEPLRRGATVLVPLVLGALVGLVTSGQWQTFLLWRHRQGFGRVEPRFGLDIGFFVFTLPWLHVVVQVLTVVLVLTLLTTVVAHYLFGGLQLPGRAAPTTRTARVHLGVVLALLCLVRAVSLVLDRYQLAVTDSRLLTGITYTRDHAVLPTKLILAGAALVCAALFVASCWTRSWRLPAVSVVLLTVTTFVVGAAYPAAVQAIKVRPSEAQLEAPYLARSIEATRAAFGLDGVRVQPYSGVSDASSAQLRADAAAVPGIRLIDPNVVSPTFRQLQALRQFYSFPDTLDVDRYTLGGKTQDSVVAVREVHLDGVPTRNWINDHTVYTHGMGFVGAYGSQKTRVGDPVFFEKGFRPSGPLGTFEPRVYFGEQSPPYSIVGAPHGSVPRELDYLDESKAGRQQTTYAGVGGVPIGTPMRRLAYALTYREPKIVLSDAVNDASRLLDHRAPLERVARVAPWLTTDGNAYPAVVDGRIQWVVDGYTTSSSYPGSRLQDLAAVTSDAITEHSGTVRASTGLVSYMRSSVKATVDAYDGTVHLYAWDEGDPVLKAWRAAFPGLVEPTSAMSAQLMSHVRYPQDLFKVQRSLLSRYHVTDPEAFYNGTDFWRVPDDPSSDGQQQPPYYQSVALPGQSRAAFSLTSQLMPVGKREVLSAYLAADSDAGSVAGQRRPGYGTLRLLQLPRERDVMGPGQVQQAIETSTTRSQDPSESLNLGQYLSQNRTGGKSVTLGNLLTLPVGGTFLYVQPIYVRANADAGAYPRVTAVVALAAKDAKQDGTSDQRDLAWAPTLEGALDGLYGQGSSGSSGTSSTAATPTARLAAAITELQRAQADARAALQKNDFGAYGAAQKRLDAAIAAAAAAAKQLPTK